MIGQQRMARSQQNEGLVRLTPATITRGGIDADGNGSQDEWMDVGVPLFPPGSVPIYAHSVNYSENFYDSDGVLVLAQSASNNFSFDQIMTSNWQKSVYTRAATRSSQALDPHRRRHRRHHAPLRLRQRIGRHPREIERTKFHTVETYALRGTNNVNRRVLTQTNTKTYGMDGSYNDQGSDHYAFDNNAKLVENYMGDVTYGVGSFVSIRAATTKTILPGDARDSWQNTLDNHPEQLFDTTRGFLASRITSCTTSAFRTAAASSRSAWRAST